MNRRGHLIIGGIAFLFYQTFINSLNTTVHYPWIFGIFVAVIGSILPDKLEPAYTRYHRGICHSHGALSLMTIFFIVSALVVLFSPAFPNLILVYLASCFFLGYLFHLLADSVTPAGLPH
jgi:membrane-bound metal-dependent hydrolase YbcI (DUF457 family)